MITTENGDRMKKIYMSEDKHKIDVHGPYQATYINMQDAS